MRVITEKITAYLHDQRTPLVDFLQTLVLAESPSDVPDTQRPVLKQLADAFYRLDFDLQHLRGVETGGHLYARPRRRKRHRASQLLLGHCDTVWPIGTLKQMPCEVHNGTLKGPGVYDMKAGLTQIVFALQTLHTLGLEPQVTPVVLVNSDEEIGSHESLPYIERLARVVDRALVLEPSLGRSGKVKTARKGIGEFEIVVKGKAAHAGLAPEEGRSAILELSFIVQRLFTLNDPVKGISVNVGTLEGGLRSNVIAPESRITIDVRVPNLDDAQQIEHQILNLQPTTQGVSLEVRGHMSRQPLERTPRNQTLWQRYRELGHEMGLTLEEGLAGGASDGNFTSLHTATLDGLGAVGDGAHAYHEFIDIDKTLERTALLTLLLLEPPVGDFRF